MNGENEDSPPGGTVEGVAREMAEDAIAASYREVLLERTAEALAFEAIKAASSEIFADKNSGRTTRRNVDRTESSEDYECALLEKKGGCSQSETARQSSVADVSSEVINELLEVPTEYEISKSNEDNCGWIKQELVENGSREFIGPENQEQPVITSSSQVTSIEVVITSDEAGSMSESINNRQCSIEEDDPKGKEPRESASPQNQEQPPISIFSEVISELEIPPDEEVLFKSRESNYQYIEEEPVGQQSGESGSGPETTRQEPAISGSSQVNELEIPPDEEVFVDWECVEEAPIVAERESETIIPSQEQPVTPHSLSDAISALEISLKKALSDSALMPTRQLAKRTDVESLVVTTARRPGDETSRGQHPHQQGGSSKWRSEEVNEMRAKWPGGARPKEKMLRPEEKGVRYRGKGRKRRPSKTSRRQKQASSCYYQDILGCYVERRAIDPPPSTLREKCNLDHLNPLERRADTGQQTPTTPPYEEYLCFREPLEVYRRYDPDGPRDMTGVCRGLIVTVEGDYVKVRNRDRKHFMSPFLDCLLGILLFPFPACHQSINTVSRTHVWSLQSPY